MVLRTSICSKMDLYKVQDKYHRVYTVCHAYNSDLETPTSSKMDFSKVKNKYSKSVIFDKHDASK